MKQLAKIGVGGCLLLEIIEDYLNNRKHFVIVDNTSARVLDVTSEIPQGSLLRSTLFRVFINDLHDSLEFSYSFIFAYNLKDNKLELAMDKCAKITLRGQDRSYKLIATKLDESKTVKDLGIYEAEDLTWKLHNDERLKKANKVLYMIRRNVAVNVKSFIKLGLYISLVLPILYNGFWCVYASQAELQSLERFHKKVARNQLRLLNFLTLQILIQMSGILFLAKFMTEDDEIIR